jgi:hypothetical protein
MDGGYGLFVCGFALGLAAMVEIVAGSASLETAGPAVVFAIAAGVVVLAHRSGWPRFVRIAGAIAALLATAAGIGQAISHASGHVPVQIELALVIAVLGALWLMEALSEPVRRLFGDRFGSGCMILLIALVVGHLPALLFFRFVMRTPPETRPITFWSLNVAFGLAFFVAAIVRAIWRAGHRRA